MEEINLLELWNFFRAKIAYIVIAILSILIIGNLFTILTRVPLYMSNTSVILVSEANNTNLGALNSELQANNTLVSTYSQIVKSRKVVNKVINNLNLDYSYKQLNEKINVSSIDDTAIIKIEVADPDRELAAKIANEVASVFMIEVQKFYHLDNVSVVDKAVPVDSAYNVNYIKDNIIYLAIGLVLSFSIIFVFFYFDTTIKTSDEIEEKYGLTVLGVIPEITKEY